MAIQLIVVAKLSVLLIVIVVEVLVAIIVVVVVVINPEKIVAQFSILYTFLNILI